MKIEDILNQLPPDDEEAYREAIPSLKKLIDADERISEDAKNALHSTLKQPYRSPRSKLNAPGKLAASLATSLGCQGKESNLRKSIDCPLIEKTASQGPDLRHMPQAGHHQNAVSMGMHINTSTTMELNDANELILRLPSEAEEPITLGLLPVEEKGQKLIIELIRLYDQIFACMPGVPSQCWSIIELDLTVEQIALIKSIPSELDDLIAEGQRNNQSYQIANLGNFNLLQIVGLSMLLAEVYEVQDRVNADAYQQAITNINWSNKVKQTYFVDLCHPGALQLTKRHNQLIKDVICLLNLRNAYDLPAPQQPYKKTCLLQSGLTKGEWVDLIRGGIPVEPSAPQIARMLHDGKDGNMVNQAWRSEDFVQTWQAMHQYQERAISRGDAEAELSASHWIPRFWINGLLDEIEIVQGAQAVVNDANHIDSASRNSPLSPPRLVWNQQPVFESVIDSNTLNRICPVQCSAIRITGPHGIIGQINRAGVSAPWQRVSGQHITPDLHVRIDPQGLAMGEVTVEFQSLNPESDFFTEVSLRLWNDDAIVSRYNHYGLLEVDAWHFRIPPNKQVTLAIPEGWKRTPVPNQRLVLGDAGVELVNFSDGQRPIVIRDDADTSWWDSGNLQAPSRRIPLELRQLKVEFIIDQRMATYVTGHLAVNGPFHQMITQVKIDGLNMDWIRAKQANSIRVGTGGLKNESLWNGLKTEIRVSFQGQDCKVLRTARPRSQAHDLIFLSRTASGVVTRVSDSTFPGTVAQFRMTGYRIISPNGIQRADIYQFNQRVGTIDDRGFRWGQIHHMGVPFHYNDSGHLMQNQALPYLMQGIVEQGCIDSMEFEGPMNDSQIVRIKLTNTIEPSPANDGHQGHHVLMLLRSSTDENGGFLTAYSSSTQQLECSPAGDWGGWQLAVPTGGRVICGVAVSYGTTLIGSWVDDRNEGVRTLLRSGQVEPGDLGILCDFLRLFNPPLFKIGFEKDAGVFFGQYRAEFQNRLQNPGPVKWDDVEIRSSVNGPAWPLMLANL